MSIDDEGTGQSSGQSPLLFRLEQFERRVMDRFDRADEDRREVGDRVNKVESRLWTMILSVAGVALLEIVHLVLRKF